MIRAAHEEFVEFAPPETPSDRKFGLTIGAILLGFAVVRWALGHAGPGTAIIAAIGALLILLGLARPGVLAPVNRAWLAVGGLMAAIVNPLVMLLMFLLIFTPIAFCMRLAGRDALGLRRKPAGESYWHDRSGETRRDGSLRFQF